MLNLDEKLLPTVFTLHHVFYSATATERGLSNMPETVAVEESVLKAARELAVHVLLPAMERLGGMTINSWFRSSVMNEVVGGVETSQHRRGEAADVDFQVGLKAAYLGIIESDIPFDQMILEIKNSGRWIHLSHKPAPKGQRRMALLSPAELVDGKRVYQPYSMKRLNELLKA